MSWTQFVVLLLVTAFFSICIPSSLGAYWCWSNRKVNGVSRLVVRVGWLFGSLAWCFMSILLMNAYGIDGPKPRYKVGFVLLYLQGVVALACAVNAVVIFLQRGGKK